MIVHRLLQLLIAVITYPIWWPMAKLMYSEVQGALMYEGGLFGTPPSPKQLDELKERYGDYESPLVSIPWARAREAQAAEKEAKRNRGKKITANEGRTSTRSAGAKGGGRGGNIQASGKSGF